MAENIEVAITQRELVACRSDFESMLLVRNKCIEAGIPLTRQMVSHAVDLRATHGWLHWCYHDIAEMWVIRWNEKAPT